MSRRTLLPGPHQPLASPAIPREPIGTMGPFLLLTTAGPGQAKADDLDGELMACCAEALAICAKSTRLWATWLAAFETAGERQPEQIAYDAHEAATLDRWHELVSQACALPARTPAGLHAKIALARIAYPAERREDPDPCDRLVFAAFADVLAGGVA